MSSLQCVLAWKCLGMGVLYDLLLRGISSAESPVWKGLALGGGEGAVLEGGTQSLSSHPKVDLMIVMLLLIESVTIPFPDLVTKEEDYTAPIFNTVCLVTVWKSALLVSKVVILGLSWLKKKGRTCVQDSDVSIKVVYNEDGGLVYVGNVVTTKHCTIEYCQFLFLIRLEVKFP